MLTQKYRPVLFGDVFGQDLAVEVLKSVVKDPESAPKSIILHGSWGSGKTTLARLVAKALNCKNRRGVEPCLTCSVCRQSIDNSPFYQEYDSSEVGSVDNIRNMKSDFFVTMPGYSWRVVVFDEFHSASRQAQTAFLKLLEDLPPNLFFLFCSTDLDKILNTIRSRSLELHFNIAGMSALVSNLKRIVSAEGVSVPDEVLHHVALYSRGHFRDSVMALDSYLMADDKVKFMETLRVSEVEILKMLIAVRRDDRDSFEKAAMALTSGILERVRWDFYNTIGNLIAIFSGKSITTIYSDMYKDVAGMYDKDLFRLFKFMVSDWVASCFGSDVTFQGLLWTLFYTFKRQEVLGGGVSTTDRLRKK